MKLKKRVVVITGASSGIGRATALACARRGAHVVLAARSARELDRVAQQCERRGGRALAVPTDVTDPGSVTALAAAATARFGRIDVWANAAGVGVLGRFDQTPPVNCAASSTSTSSAPSTGPGPPCPSCAGRAKASSST
ncbi:SDR family NAD(P)-dependent oxidoreductase [Streptomyces cirratus]|uniref:SDR family NAD(P)-dependent oxidoreductase n=1 Tax=Streptomyces cirratus TaxID=68187 RepID=UPI0036158120